MIVNAYAGELLLAALAEDEAERRNDDPNLKTLHTNQELHHARNVRRWVVACYLAHDNDESWAT